MKEHEGHARRFYDRISGAYDSIADAGEHRCRERGLELLNVLPGTDVLEIGFGTGHTLVSLAGAVGEQGSVCGVDISQGMHDVARARLEKAELAERVQLAVQAVPPLPYNDQQFDAVTLSFTLELFPLDLIPEVLQEIGRVLRPEGTLGVVSMALVEEGERESLLERTYKWMHLHFPHIVDCQPIDASGLVAAAGFRIARSERLDLFTMPVAALLAENPKPG